MRVAAVTVNYCCAGEIAEHMDEISAQLRDACGEWFIVDNRSPDNSLTILREAVTALPNVHLIEGSKNGGFGYGNNLVINKVVSGEIDADYVYLLNPDAVPEPGAIKAMIDYLDAHSDVGVVGSGLINEDGSHTDSMFRFPSFWSEVESALSFGPVSRMLQTRRQSLGELNHPHPVDWVAGTSLLARAEALRAVGGFDEDFFLYWEEIELCHRIKRRGFQIHGLPQAKVRHVGGVSTGMHQADNRIPAYWHRSRNLYFRKTASGGPLPVLNFVTATSIAVRRSLDFLRRKPAKHPGFLRDHIREAIGLPPH